MTLQALTSQGIWVPSYPALDGFITNISQQDGGVMDATGERVHCVGRLFLPGRTGSKTISAAGGGAIWWTSGAVTNNNGGTVFRVGIQDADLTAGPAARGDAGWDVHGENTGSGIVAGTARNTWSMTSGSKTIAHGDFIAVVFQMTTRGGSDSIIARQAATGVAAASPSVTLETSGPTFTAQTAIPNVVIVFDDGTFGWFAGTTPVGPAFSTNTAAFNSGSTPDEYCNIFRVPFACKVDQLQALVGPASGADFEMILYSDPLGTPAVIESVTCDANTVSSTTVRGYIAQLTTPRTLTINTDYAIAVRPTTTNSVTLREMGSISSSNAGWQFAQLGTGCYKATRSNQSGAFSATDSTRMLMAVCISALDDGAGAGGGIRAAGHGGLAA